MPPLPGSLPGGLPGGRETEHRQTNMNTPTIGAPWVGAPWTPRAWQREALPIIVDALKRRQRGIVSAVMGSGKSILQSELVALALAKAGHRSIVVTVPRQALVRQLAATIGARIGEDRVGVFYGSKKQPGRQVVVCCNASLPRLWEELQSYPKGRRPDDLRRGPRHPGRGAA
jgi:superfamily II DNA or RNA helicase